MTNDAAIGCCCCLMLTVLIVVVYGTIQGASAASKRHAIIVMQSEMHSSNLSELSATCPRKVGDCSFSGPLASIGLGQDCWQWRGNVSCVSGSCVCVEASDCAASGGYCLDSTALDAGFVKRGFTLRSGRRHLRFNVSSSTWWISVGDAVRGDPLYLFQLPGNHSEARMLLGPDKDLRYSMKVAQDDFETIPNADCFSLEDDFTMSVGNMWGCSQKSSWIKDFKRACREANCPAFVFTGGHCKAYFRPTSKTWLECYKAATATEISDLYIRNDFVEILGPATTPWLVDGHTQQWLRLDVKAEGSVAIVAGGAHMTNWCLQIVEDTHPRLQWVQPSDCNAAWTLEPHMSVKEMQHLSNDVWSLPAALHVSADDNLTCEEKKALGPDSMMAFGSLSILIGTKTILTYLFQSESSLTSAETVGLAHDFVFLAKLALALLICILGPLLAVLAVPISLALLPVMENFNKWNHIDRAIAFCLSDVPFTWAFLPMYAMKIVYGIYGMTCGWKGYQDPDKEDGWKKYLPIKSWILYQMQDAYFDAAAVPDMMKVCPPVLVLLFLVTVVYSLVLATMSYRGTVDYPLALRLRLPEDILQFSLMLWAFMYKAPSEFMLYSSLQSLAGIITNARTVHDECQKHGKVLARALQQPLIDLN